MLMTVSMLLFAKLLYRACHIVTNFHYRMNNNSVNKRREVKEQNQGKLAVSAC